MFIQHLRQQRDEYQKIYDLLSKQKQELDTAYAVATDVLREFELEAQREHIEAKRTKVALKIQELDDQIEKLDYTARLLRALRKLDYRHQINVFQQLLDKSQIGALMIHGEPRHGQKWLLDLLVDQVPYIIYPECKIIEITAWDINDIRFQLGRFAGLTNPYSLQKIAERFHEWWQDRTVILIIHNVELIDVKCIQEFFHEFWQPLVEKAQSEPYPLPYYRFLMFLIANHASVDAWPMVCTEQIDTKWKPHIIVKPPKLARFSKDLLIEWMSYEFSALPANMHSVSVEDILTNSMDGIPEYALQYIDDVCNCSVLKRGPKWIQR